MALLGDDDFSGGDEAACCCSGGFHEVVPCGAVAGVGDGAGGFAGADGFACATLMEQAEDGFFERFVFGGGLVGAAGVAAELDVVPVTLPLFAPGDGAAAGCAGLGGDCGFHVGASHTREL